MIQPSDTPRTMIAPEAAGPTPGIGAPGPAMTGHPAAGGSASLAKILAAIPDKQVREYVASNTIYGYLARAVAVVLDEISERPAAATAAHIPQGTPKITDEEADAIENLIRASVDGVNWEDEPRLVVHVMHTLRDLMVRIQQLEQVLGAARTTLAAAFTGTVDDCGKLEHISAIEALRRLTEARAGFLRACVALESNRPQRGDKGGDG